MHVCGMHLVDRVVGEVHVQVLEHVYVYGMYVYVYGMCMACVWHVPC